MTRFGDTPNMAKEAVRMKRNVRAMVDNRKTSDPAIVTAYDAANQTVDVKLKTAPDEDGAAREPTYKSVPIQGAGSKDPDIRQILTEDDAGGPTVGFLIFPRCDSREAYINQDVIQAPTKRCHAGRGPVFHPAIPVESEAKPNGLITDSPGADDIAPGDRAVVANAGDVDKESYLALKKGGDMVLNVANELRLPNVPGDSLGGDTLKVEDGVLKRATSSIRFKDNVRDLESPLLPLLLTPRTFERKGVTEVGFIAEEAIKVGFEDVVTWIPIKYVDRWETLTEEYLEEYERDGRVPSGFDYARLTTYLLALVKEQRRAINDLIGFVNTIPGPPSVNLPLLEWPESGT